MCVCVIQSAPQAEALSLPFFLVFRLIVVRMLGCILTFAALVSSFEGRL